MFQTVLPNAVKPLILVGSLVLCPMAAGACDGASRQSASPADPVRSSLVAAPDVSGEASIGHAKAWAKVAAPTANKPAKADNAPNLLPRANLLGPATAAIPVATAVPQVAAAPDDQH